VIETNFLDSCQALIPRKSAKPSDHFFPVGPRYGAHNRKPFPNGRRTGTEVCTTGQYHQPLSRSSYNPPPNHHSPVNKNFQQYCIVDFIDRRSGCPTPHFLRLCGRCQALTFVWKIISELSGQFPLFRSWGSNISDSWTSTTVVGLVV